MKLRIVRVSHRQFVGLMNNLTAINRFMVGGLPVMHTYLPGENVLIMPEDEVSVSKFPEDGNLTYVSAIQCAMEDKS